MFKRIRFPLLVGSLIAIACPDAYADQIDGIWCSPAGKSISIDGPRVVTPAGNTVIAQYDRHHIDYEIPEGEPNAGDRLTADQLNDNEIEVTIAGGDASEARGPQIWTPCKPIS